MSNPPPEVRARHMLVKIYSPHKDGTPVRYYIKTACSAYSFDFAVQQGTWDIDKVQRETCKRSRAYKSYKRMILHRMAEKYKPIPEKGRRAFQ